MKLRLSPLLVAAACAVPATASAQSAAESMLTPGTPAQGQLEASDAIDELRGQPADTWSFEATAGQGVRISLGSDVVDTYLILRDPQGNVLAQDDDGAGNLDSLIEMRLPADGTYTVAATSFSGGTGPYAIELTEIDASQLPDPTRAIVDGAITIGGTVSGTLESADAIYRERDTFADSYAFEATAGQPIEAHLRSTEFDGYLLLVGPTGELVAQDDDSGAGTDSRVRTTAGIDGRYRLVATTFGGGATGAYELELRGEWTSPTEGATELARGTTVSGNLVDGEARYYVDASASETLVVDVMSDEFDTYVSVFDANDMNLTSDDDGGDGTNSRARVTPYADGPVIVVVSSYSGNTTGAFTVRVGEPAPVTVDPRALRFGRAVEGELTDDDARSPQSGTITDVYTIAADAGDTFTVLASGAGDDPYGTMGAPNLRVFSPLGEEVYDNSSYMGGPTARRIVRAAMGGTYLVTVGGWETGMQYTLEAVEGAEAGPGWGDTEIEPIELGASIDGAHDENDASHPERGTRMDVYELVVDEATFVSIDMNSDLFDTYLEVRSADHALLHSNDDYEGLNSRITATLSAGTYHVVATQFSMGEGIYTLSVETGAVSATEIGEIGVGDTVTGSFSDASTIADYGSPAVFYTFEAAAGQALTIRANAEGADTMLTLRDAHGAQVAWNDDADGELNSRISVTIPRAGIYTIAVSEYGGAGGTFELSLQEGIEGGETTPYMGDGAMGYPEPYMDY